MRKLTLLTLILVLLLSGMSYAIVVDLTEEAVPIGTKYSFSIENDLSEEIFSFYLSVPTSIDNIFLTEFGSPMGWGDGFGGSEPLYGMDSDPDKSFIEWFADFGEEIPSNGTLNSFSFITEENIQGTISYSANQSGLLVAPYGGVLQVEAVPEPGAMFLFAIGMFGWIYNKAKKA